MTPNHDVARHRIAGSVSARALGVPNSASWRSEVFGALALPLALATYAHLDGRWPASFGDRFALLSAALLGSIAALAAGGLALTIASTVADCGFVRVRAGLVTAIKLHAAATFSLCSILVLTFRHGGTIDDALAAIFLVCAVLVLLMLAAVPLAAAASWPEARKRSLGVMRIVTAALLGGWGLGVLMWSGAVPGRVTAAAEVAAAGRPYCIDAAGKPPARGRTDLTGSRMYLNDGGLRYHFYALLIIVEPGGERRFMNWSHRNDRLEPVGDDARARLQLDKLVRCVPRPHYARDWP